MIFDNDERFVSVAKPVTRRIASSFSWKVA